MALSGTTVWEVRTEGSDNNGGGYTSGGTDYSTRDTPILALTDLATSGVGVTTLTSVAGGFTSAMVGNIIQILSGTNVVAGYYEIATHVDTNTVTIDRAPDDAVGGIASGVGNVGGALGSPGALHEILTVAQMSAWIRGGASPTYTLTTTTAGKAGSIALDLVASADYLIRGYNATRGDLEGLEVGATTPVLDVAALTSFTVIDINAHDNRARQVTGLKIDGQSGASVIGFADGGNVGGDFVGCMALDCTTGFSQARPTGCIAEGCTTGFSAGTPRFSVAKNCTTGFSAGSPTNCLAFGGTTGFTGVQRLFVQNCTAVGCSDDGFQVTNDTVSFYNCVATHCGGWGFGSSSAAFGNRRTLINCAATTNTSGNVEHPSYLDTGFVDFGGAVDPWVNRAGDDYTPNDTAGSGLLLWAGSYTLPGQTDPPDIGALQHADPVGGGTVVISRPRRIM